jgi:hypothetical protein
LSVVDTYSMNELLGPAPVPLPFIHRNAYCSANCPVEKQHIT